MGHPSPSHTPNLAWWGEDVRWLKKAKGRRHTLCKCSFQERITLDQNPSFGKSWCLYVFFPLSALRCQPSSASPGALGCLFLYQIISSHYDFSRKMEHFLLEANPPHGKGEWVTLQRLPPSLWSHLEAKKVSGYILMTMELWLSEDQASRNFPRWLFLLTAHSAAPEPLSDDIEPLK